MEPPGIVMINDDPVYIAVMHDLLTDEGWEVISCRLGATALLAVKDRQPAVVVLDIGIDQADTGICVLQQLRDNPQTAHIPVVVCSGEEQCIQTSLTAVQHPHWFNLIRPFKIDAVLAAIQHAFHTSNRVHSVNG